MGVTCLNVGIAPAYNPPVVSPPVPPPDAIVNVTPPSFNSPLVFGQANNFNQGSWTGPIATNRSWIFLIAPVTPTSTNYTGAAPNTLPIHTPRAPAVAGTTQLVIRETVYLADGVTVAGTADSVPVLVQAAVIPLSIVTVLTPIDFFINQPASSTSPVSVDGGVPPYTITTANLTSSIPNVSMATATGSLSGTPIGPVLSDTVFTTQVVDSAGNGPVSTQWHATVSNTGVTPIPVLQLVGIAAVEAYGFDFGPYQGVTISGTNVNGSTVRLQRFTNVLSTGKSGYLRRICQTDPISSGSGQRCENSRDDENQVLGSEWWWAFAINPNTGEWYTSLTSGASPYVIWQIHQKNPAALPGPTLGFVFDPTTGRMYMGIVSGASPIGTEINVDCGVGPTAGAWTRYVINARYGNFSQGQSPFLNVWRNGVQVCASNTSIGQIGDVNYPRIGFYRWRYGVSDYAGLNAVSAYYSEPYEMQGSNLLAQSLAAVAAFV